MEFKTGDRVLNGAKPEWGQGEVLHMEGNAVLVRFDNGSVRKIKSSFLKKEEASLPPLQADKAAAVQEGIPEGEDGIIARVLAMLGESGRLHPASGRDDSTKQGK